jgi:hypothetical protein
MSFTDEIMMIYFDFFSYSVTQPPHNRPDDRRRKPTIVYPIIIFDKDYSERLSVSTGPYHA